LVPLAQGTAAADDDDDDDKHGEAENGPAANGELAARSELLDELELILFLKILLMLDTLGTLYLSQIFSLTSRSLISQANMPGSRALSSLMNITTRGVVTLGLLPPIAPGMKEPVSLKRANIFDTHPCDTLSCRLMSHGLTPSLAISMMRPLIRLGNGRPLTK
jgi:hypothetical protein